MNGRFHAWTDRRRATEVTTALFGDTLSQVAGSTAAMHGLSFGGQPEPFLGSLVRFDLRLSFCLTHRSRHLLAAQHLPKGGESALVRPRR